MPDVTAGYGAFYFVKFVEFKIKKFIVNFEKNYKYIIDTYSRVTPRRLPLKTKF